MSLKAKIEAVIYASEEPVTLAQLTGLLGHEAQAELDQLDAAQHRLALEIAPGPDASETSPDHAQAEAEIDPQDPRNDATEDQDALNSELLDPVPASTPPPAEQGSEAPQPELETAEAPQPEATAADGKKSPRETKEERERARRLREYFRSILDQLIADYATESNDRGLEIREVAGGYRLATKPEYHDAVRGFVKSLKPPLKLSLQALETLAVVAYKQPVTAPEVSEIRGVDSGGTIGSLITRKLVTTAGRKQVIGRPMLYKTTKDFLLRFGLKDIAELPSIEEFEKMAGELADSEPIQEEIPMHHHDPEAPESDSESDSSETSSSEADAPEPVHHAPESPAQLEPHRHTHAPQADGSPDTADNPLDIEVEDALEDNPLQHEDPAT